MQQTPDRTPAPPARATTGAAGSAGPRPANEDSYAVPPPGFDGAGGWLWIVADGVGGQAAGSQASQLAAATLSQTFYEQRQKGHDMAAGLRAAVAQANEAVYEAAAAQGLDRMGSTVVAAAWNGRELTTAHVGDSRAYVLRNGRLQQVTRDHTWVQEQVDQGHIRPADAARHDLRHVVTRVLGNNPTVEVTITGPLAATSGDLVMLCSDGLHDVVGEAKMQQLLTAHPPQKAAEALLAEALRQETGDNTTVVVAGLGMTPQPAAAVPPPAPTAGRKRSPLLWLALLALIGVGLAAAAWLVGGLDGGEAVEAAPSVTPDAQQLVAPALTPPAPSATMMPAATSTAAALAPVETEEIGEQATFCPGGAVLYFWSDEQAGDNDLCESAADRFGPEDRFLLLEAETTRFRGSGNATCEPLDFAHVQPADLSLPSGWVQRIQIVECGE